MAKGKTASTAQWFIYVQGRSAVLGTGSIPIQVALTYVGGEPEEVWIMATLVRLISMADPIVSQQASVGNILLFRLC